MHFVFEFLNQAKLCKGILTTECPRKKCSCLSNHQNSVIRPIFRFPFPAKEIIVQSRIKLMTHFVFWRKFRVEIPPPPIAMLKADENVIMS